MYVKPELFSLDFDLEDIITASSGADVPGGEGETTTEGYTEEYSSEPGTEPGTEPTTETTTGIAYTLPEINVNL